MFNIFSGYSLAYRPNHVHKLLFSRPVEPLTFDRQILPVVSDGS